MADAILTPSPAPTVEPLRQQLDEVNDLLWAAYTLVHAAAADADHCESPKDSWDEAELTSPASRVVRLLMLIEEKLRAAIAVADRPARAG